MDNNKLWLFMLIRWLILNEFEIKGTNETPTKAIKFTPFVSFAGRKKFKSLDRVRSANAPMF